MAMRFVDIFSLNMGTPAGSNQEKIIQYPNSSKEWIINSDTTYPIPTIHVTQIGETILASPTIVQTEWQYLNALQLRITFEQPCSGFVILHTN